jgi:hypothetical protein
MFISCSGYGSKNGQDQVLLIKKIKILFSYYFCKFKNKNVAAHSGLPAGVQIRIALALMS